MNVATIFADTSLTQFVDDYYHRLPFARRGAAESVRELGSWPMLGKLLASPGADIMVVRDGARLDGDSPGDLAGAQSLSDDGYTILVRHAERHEPGLGELARSFSETFCSPVDLHVYATPANRHGFSWHYDAEDVFILQTGGEKEYFLRKNTVQPWPLIETLPSDMHYEREIMPLMRVLLQAGDLLYIPCGYWHKAEARGNETSLSLSVGLAPRSAMNIYDLLRTKLMQSLVWRQRLPLASPTSSLTREELELHYRGLITQLAGDIHRTLTDPLFVDELLGQLLPPPEAPSPLAESLPAVSP